MQLVLAFWSAKPHWIPRNPKLMVTICPVVSRGLTLAARSSRGAPPGADGLAIFAIVLNHEAIGQHGPLFDHDHAFLNGIQRMVGILEMVTAVDAHIVADAAVLVHDGIADITAVADADRGKTMRPGEIDLFDRFIIVYPHQVAADDGGAGTDAGPDADDAVLDARGIDDTTFGYDGFLQGGAADLCRREHPRTGIDGFFVVEQIEVRDVLGQAQIGLEKGRDVPDIGPVAFVLIADDLVFFQRLRDDLLPKVRRFGKLVLQQIGQELAVEDIDTH